VSKVTYARTVELVGEVSAHSLTQFLSFVQIVINKFRTTRDLRAFAQFDNEPMKVAAIFYALFAVCCELCEIVQRSMRLRCCYNLL
jgi:hypothetical protein